MSFVSHHQKRTDFVVYIKTPLKAKLFMSTRVNNPLLKQLILQSGKKKRLGQLKPASNKIRSLIDEFQEKTQPKAKDFLTPLAYTKAIVKLYQSGFQHSRRVDTNGNIKVLA